MGYSRTYQGIIWTNHVLERLKARKIPQEYAWKTFRFPDGSKQGKSGGSQEFTKKIGVHASQDPNFPPEWRESALSVWQRKSYKNQERFPSKNLRKSIAGFHGCAWMW